MKIKKTLCGVLLTISLLAGCNSGNVPTANTNNAPHQMNSHTTKALTLDFTMDGEKFYSAKEALKYLKDKYEADSVYYKLIETFDVGRLEEIISKMQDRNDAEGKDRCVINMYEVITRIIAIQSVANVAKISRYDIDSDYYSIPSFTIFNGIQR